MESIQRSIGELMATFQSRMTAFENELQKNPVPLPTNTHSATLASEFATFRTFIIQAVSTIQQQVEVLAQSVDNLEMQGRRKILLMHGVAEDDQMDTEALLVNLVHDKLHLNDVTVSDIKRCHRMGRALVDKPRPILFKLSSTTVRDKIWFAKKYLKGTGITISEFLTKQRHDIFLAAREKYGVTQCWTLAGNVYVLGSDGERRRIVTMADLNRIAPAGTQSKTPANVIVKPVKLDTPVKATTIKPRRVKK